MGPGPGLVTQFFSRKILARTSEEKIPARRKTYSSPKFWVVGILYLRVNLNSNSQIRKTKIERERREPCASSGPPQTRPFYSKSGEVAGLVFWTPVEQSSHIDNLLVEYTRSKFFTF